MTLVHTEDPMNILSFTEIQMWKATVESKKTWKNYFHKTDILWSKKTLRGGKKKVWGHTELTGFVKVLKNTQVVHSH